MPEFMINFRITGRMGMIVKADNLAAAERIAEMTANEEEHVFDLEEVDDVDYTIFEMKKYRTPGGREVKATHPRPGFKEITE